MQTPSRSSLPTSVLVLGNDRANTRIYEKVVSSPHKAEIYKSIEDTLALPDEAATLITGLIVEANLGFPGTPYEFLVGEEIPIMLDKFINVRQLVLFSGSMSHAHNREHLKRGYEILHRHRESLTILCIEKHPTTIGAVTAFFKGTPIIDTIHCFHLNDTKIKLWETATSRSSPSPMSYGSLETGSGTGTGAGAGGGSSPKPRHTSTITESGCDSPPRTSSPFHESFCQTRPGPARSPSAYK